jgi:hypothetical protein
MVSRVLHAPVASTPRKESPLPIGWVDLRAGLKAARYREISWGARNPTQATEPVAIKPELMPVFARNDCGTVQSGSQEHPSRRFPAHKSRHFTDILVETSNEEYD